MPQGSRASGFLAPPETVNKETQAVSRPPNDRKYTATHEWAKVDGDLVTIGITAFAAAELTDITYVELPTVGTRVEAGRPFGEIESVKATGELNSAVAGEVVEVNSALAQEPGLVNSDPYGRGWMIRVRAADLSPCDSLMDAAAYEALLAGGR